VTSELSFIVSLPITCAHCDKEFAEIAAKLARLDHLTCPHCGTELALTSADWAAFRDKIKEFCIGKSSPPTKVK
jgi:hypothetical protein